MASRLFPVQYRATSDALLISFSASDRFSANRYPGAFEIKQEVEAVTVHRKAKVIRLETSRQVDLRQDVAQINRSGSREIQPHVHVSGGVLRLTRFVRNNSPRGIRIQHVGACCEPTSDRGGIPCQAMYEPELLLSTHV